MHGPRRVRALDRRDAAVVRRPRRPGRLHAARIRRGRTRIGSSPRSTGPPTATGCSTSATSWATATGSTDCGSPTASSCPRALLEQVGGFDESFSMPGGGYANLEIYERLGASPDVTVTTIVGEGSFHQMHGGTTTNQPDAAERRRACLRLRRALRRGAGPALPGPGQGRALRRSLPRSRRAPDQVAVPDRAALHRGGRPDRRRRPRGGTGADARGPAGILHRGRLEDHAVGRTRHGSATESTRPPRTCSPTRRSSPTYGRTGSSRSGRVTAAGRLVPGLDLRSDRPRPHRVRRPGARPRPARAPAHHVPAGTVRPSAAGGGEGAGHDRRSRGHGRGDPRRPRRSTDHDVPVRGVRAIRPGRDPTSSSPTRS